MQTEEPSGEKNNMMLDSEYEQTNVISALKEEIINFRGVLGQIDNSLLFPMPFPYYHVVNLAMKIQLLFISYASLFMNSGKGSLWSCFLFPVTAYLILGLVEVANNMADPFGDSDNDFNQPAIIKILYNESKSICELPPEEFLVRFYPYDRIQHHDQSFQDKLGSKENMPILQSNGDFVDIDAMSASELNALELPALPVKEINWSQLTVCTSQADVDCILKEKQALEDELRRSGIPKLSEQVDSISSVTAQQRQGSLLQERMVDKVKSIRQQMSEQQIESKLLRAGTERLEDMTSVQMKRIERIEEINLTAIESLNKTMLQIESRYNQHSANQDTFGFSLVNKVAWNGEQHLLVQEVINGSSAHRAGLNIGDELIAVDGINANEMQFYELVNYISEKSSNEIVVDIVKVNDNSKLSPPTLFLPLLFSHASKHICLQSPLNTLLRLAWLLAGCAGEPRGRLQRSSEWRWWQETKQVRASTDLRARIEDRRHSPPRYSDIQLVVLPILPLLRFSFPFMCSGMTK
eukprot:749332-Hanusia_phi.AAC.5